MTTVTIPNCTMQNSFNFALSFIFISSPELGYIGQFDHTQDVPERKIYENCVCSITYGANQYAHHALYVLCITDIGAIGLETELDQVFPLGEWSLHALQNDASWVLESCQDSTLRLCQSMMAARYRKP